MRATSCRRLLRDEWMVSTGPTNRERSTTSTSSKRHHELDACLGNGQDGTRSTAIQRRFPQRRNSTGDEYDEVKTNYSCGNPTPSSNVTSTDVLLNTVSETVYDPDGTKIQYRERVENGTQFTDD